MGILFDGPASLLVKTIPSSRLAISCIFKHFPKSPT